MIEAAKYNVLPLDDRRFERFNPDLAGRPQLAQGTSQLLFGGMGRLSEHSVLSLKNKSHAITAEIVVPDGGAEGVILSQGGAFGGFALYIKDGRPAYCYNLFGLQQFKVYGEDGIPTGEHQLRMEFSYDGGGLGKGGDVTLYLDGNEVGGGRVDGDRADALLGGRDDRRRARHRDTGERRLRPGGQRVHRQGSMGTARHRRRGRGHRPPDRPRRSGSESRWPDSRVVLITSRPRI